MKIIKHCQEEGSGGTDLVQGVLLGLVVESRLEITNCFSFPRHNDDDDFDEGLHVASYLNNLVLTIPYFNQNDCVNLCRDNVCLILNSRLVAHVNAIRNSA